MKAVLPLLTAAALALTTGCSSTFLTAKDPAMPPNGDAQLVVHRDRSTARATIAAVDQRFNQKAFLDGYVPLEPGTHTVRLSLRQGLNQGVTDLALTADPARLYRVHALADGLGFRVRVWDETEGRSNRTLVAETYATASQYVRPAAPISETHTELSSPSYQMPNGPNLAPGMFTGVPTPPP